MEKDYKEVLDKVKCKLCGEETETSATFMKDDMYVLVGADKEQAVVMHKDDAICNDCNRTCTYYINVKDANM